MSLDPFDIPLPFLKTSRKTAVTIKIVQTDDLKGWIKSQKETVKAAADISGFSHSSPILALSNTFGKIDCIYGAVPESANVYDFAKLYVSLTKQLSSDFFKTASFEFSDLRKPSEETAFIGWGMAAYSYKYTENKKPPAASLVWNKTADQKSITAQLKATYLLRNLINIPAYNMGPSELENAVRTVAAQNKASVKVIKGKPLENGFPLIHAVGMASGTGARAPRLIELNWSGSKAKNAKTICLVGKGVCFDTGGLDLKPSQYMRYMKKDMGGAAHALALASIIMSKNLSVRLRLLIPAVENAVAAESFRPGDIFKSRKGITVENTNTDAEGRLVLADTLTYATEDKAKPDLVIDFATLTGSARAALGQDIPAMFSNDDTIGQELQKTAIASADPLWQMPLWDGYKSIIESSAADLHNSAGVPGDLIYSALFLQKFLVDTPKAPNWVHVDCFAWENAGRPGRSKGGMDTGLRALATFLTQRYG
jgi:leucyl aminopeptidase